jgi:hypothetical protein
MLHTRDGKTYTGQMSLADGQFSIAVADGRDISISPADLGSIDFHPPSDSDASTRPGDTRPPDQASIGTGLSGAYYSDSFFHHLGMVRGDPQIAMNYPSQDEPFRNPAAPWVWTTLSIRWTGRIRPTYSERYTFFAPSGALTRLWIDNCMILDFGQSEATVNFQAGKEYDIRVDWINHTSNTLALLEWSSPSQRREPVTAQCLFPPEHAPLMPPTVGLATPRDDSVLVGPVDLPMHVVVNPGTSKPMQVAYCDGKVPIGVAKSAPFDLLWHDAPIGDHLIVATVTNADGHIGVSVARHVVIASNLDGALPKPWVTCDVPALGLQAKADARPADGNGEIAPRFHNQTLMLYSTGGDLYGQSDAFQFVFQPLVGNGSIVARIAKVSADQQGAQPQAGIMFRSTALGDSPCVAMLAVPNVGNVFLSRLTPGGPVNNSSTTGSGPVYLKLSRHGSTISGYRSGDGRKWEFMGQADVDMPQSMLVGVICCGEGSGATAIADHLSVSTASDAPPPIFHPSVELTDGTRIVGQIAKIDRDPNHPGDATATIAPADPSTPQLPPTPLANIARIFYQPVPPNALVNLSAKQTGALLDSGDFYDGQIDDFRPDAVTIDSVVFGKRDFNPQALCALILHPLAAPAGYEADLADGSVIHSPTLAVTPSGIALEPQGGKMNLPMRDLLTLQKLK